MKTLIAEDDFTSRILLQKILGGYGPHSCVGDGREAVEAVRAGLRTGKPYDLICLDIMMPKMDGQAALKYIREMEEEHRIPLEKRAKVIMITALADRANVLQACQNQCDYFLVKPIDKGKVLAELRRLGLIPEEGVALKREEADECVSS